MTTFTLQDLNGAQQKALDDQALQDMAKLGGVDPLSEMFTQMGRDLANHELAHQQAQQARLDAPESQPSEIDPIKLIDEMMSQFSIKLKLLATVISQAKAQPDTTPPEGTNVPSLQETISLTLQQADWFRTMVRHELVALDIEEIAKEAVESVVEDEVESYFEHRFDCTDHFDFDDAVSNEVHDRLDDVVRDRVMDSLEEVVAEKLSEASIKVEFN